MFPSEQSKTDTPTENMIVLVVSMIHYYMMYRFTHAYISGQPD